MKFMYIVLAIVIAYLLLKVFSGASAPEDIPENATDTDILNLARQGRKIQAIKWYRALHGVGLKEAKEAVEEMLKKGVLTDGT
ncbi:ribosomal protein L7/L12 [Thermodesulfobacteriota bacterium]